MMAQEHSDWPTYPQLYVGGATLISVQVDVLCVSHLHSLILSFSQFDCQVLVFFTDITGDLLGGCDIVLEMAADGELKEVQQE